MSEQAPRRDIPLGPPVTVYEFVGGQAFFDVLAARFYEGVAIDPVLRPLYPDDLTDSIGWLAGFLAQYWGGPGTYSEQRGHPRLRMRHAGFAITSAERDAWLAHMNAAVRSAVLPAEVEAQMLEYFERAADHLRNAPERDA